MAIPSWKMMPALVCGNTVVMKPAEDTPLSTYNLVQILEEAGLPRGVVNVVFGDGPDAGAPLLEHPDVQARQLHRLHGSGPHREPGVRARRSKIAILEMGGKNIIIVMDDANLDLAVDGAIWGGFGTTGQRCTAASRVAVHKKVYSEFVDKFVTRAQTLKVGDGLNPDHRHGPVHQRAAASNRDEVRRNRQGRRRETRRRRQSPRKWRATRTAGSTSRPCSAIAIRRCASARKKFSARWFR